MTSHSISGSWRHRGERVKITAEMKRALRVLLAGSSSVNAGTLKALTRRGLADGHALTPWGWATAVSLLPLKDQCRFLSIPLHRRVVPSPKRVEVAVRDMLIGEGRAAAYCEGGSLSVLVYCCVFWRLYDLAIKQWGGAEGARSFMYTSVRVFAWLQEREPRLVELMLEDVAAARESQVASAFDVLRGWQPLHGWSFREWVGVERDFIIRLFGAIDSETRVALAREVLDPQNNYSRGWPDLTSVSADSVVLYEVKSTDRLHFSQVVTISEACSRIGLPVEVIQVLPRSSGA